MIRKSTILGVGIGLLVSILSIAPAQATGGTLYVAPTGSVGLGTSCASPGYVGGSSISTAVAAAADGDTIILCDGTFNVSSQIFIEEKELTISGQNSASQTIINGSASNNGIFKIISKKNVKIEKITFFQGYSSDYGGAILMSLKPSESLSTTRHVITNNFFVQNRAGEQGGAIFGGGDNMGTGDFLGILTISNNTFIENYAAVDGGAIVLAAVAFNETRIVIDSNKFLYNRAGGRAAGALVSNFNTLTALDNIYYLNTTGDVGNSETLYGRMKIGGDIIMNNLSAGRRDCRLEDLTPTITRTTRVDNPYCLFFDDTQVSGLTSITRAQGLALTGNFIPQSPLVSSSTVQTTSVDLNLGVRDSGGASITQYSYSLGGAPYVNFPAGASTTQTISGLTANTSYTVQLKATSAAGTSYASGDYSFTTAALPADAPTIAAATGQDLALSISFSLGADNGNAIWDVYYSLDGAGYISSGSTTSPLVITGLTGRTSYLVSIKSENSAGLSSASNSMTAVTLDFAQDESDKAAAKELERLAQLERQKKIADARARVLQAVKAGILPSASDLLGAEFPAVVSATIPSMLESIPYFSQGESTTSSDLLVAAKAVEIVQTLKDESAAKRLTAVELVTVGVSEAGSKFKSQVLRGVVAAPVADKESIVELRVMASRIFAELQERRNKVLAIIEKIRDRNSSDP